MNFGVGCTQIGGTIDNSAQYLWDIFNLLSVDDFLIQCGQVRPIPLTRLCHSPAQALQHLLQPRVL